MFNSAQRRYTGYADLRCQLIRELANKKAVDLWIRRENNRTQTNNVYYWEYASPPKGVETDRETLEIDLVEIANRPEYIIAAVGEESTREIPIPLSEFYTLTLCLPLFN
jgi:hypothetical protein